MPPRRSTRTINVDGVALELVIERKGVKNLNARLTGSTLSVSAPFGMPQKELDEAVLKLAQRLLRRAYASRTTRGPLPASMLSRPSAMGSGSYVDDS